MTLKELKVCIEVRYTKSLYAVKLAEAEHFMEVNGCSKEEAEDNAKQEDCIVWDAD